jgi:hypothetical protein
LETYLSLLFLGSVPFLRIGRRCVADFTPINETISRVGLRLSADLDDLQLAEMHAHMCAVQETLKYAEVCVDFIDLFDMGGNMTCDLLDVLFKFYICIECVYRCGFVGVIQPSNKISQTGVMAVCIRGR